LPRDFRAAPCLTFGLFEEPRSSRAVSRWFSSQDYQMKYDVWVLVLCGLTPAIALADDPPPPPQDVWTGKGQAGYVSSQGNSDAKSANAAIDAAFLDGPWKHAFHLDGLYGQSAGIVSAERWATSWQSNYNLSPQLYTFGALRYEHDMFSGFQYQESLTGGLGYKIFDTATTKLDVQAGAGYKRLRPEDLIKDPDGAVVQRIPLTAESGAIGTLGVNYSQALTGTTTLTDKLLIESGSSNTLSTNALAVAVKISTKLALSVGYTVTDNSDPPAGLKKIDTLETVNLVYAF
jgi:putative salt-induced outer membrane protein